MIEPLRLPMVDFAGWARGNGVRLPYPLDINDVPAPPSERSAPADPVLETATAVFGAPRLGVFALRADPSGQTAVAVATAGRSEAVLVTVDGDEVRLREVPDSELVTSVVRVLPDLAAARLDPVEVTESDWADALAAGSTLPPGSVDLSARLARAGLGDRLCDVLRSVAPSSIAIGTLGVLTWRDERGVGRLGPGMASWHEYPGGAVLAHLRVPRHGGSNRVRICGFTPDDAARALAEAVAVAVYRPRE